MIDEVTAALAALKAEGGTSVELTLGSEALHLVVQGIGPLSFPITNATARKLCLVADPAPFGRGSETVHDTRVRDAWQIDRSRLKVDTRRWRRALDPVLATLRQRLGLPAGVELAVVLDKLLVYGPGQFFATHQDSERDDDMVGTLVVTLPSEYEGGEIVVEHRGEKRTYRGAGRGPTDLSLLAFYADCRHEVKPVKSGHRISLTYHLLRRGEATESPPLRPVAVDGLAASVASFFATPVAPRYGTSAPQRPDRLVYLLDHEYSQKSLGWDRLKNADRLRAAALREVAGRLDCELYLALADVHEVWQCDDDWYGYDRRNRRYRHDDEDDARIEGHNHVDLVDDSIELRHWIDPDGGVETGVSAGPERREICFTRPSIEMDPFKSEYEGYMGNYGDTMERWYHRAAVVMWPRARNFVIRAKMSPVWAVEALVAMVEAGAVDQALGRARELVPFWKAAAPSESHSKFVPTLLTVLNALDAADLAFELLAPLGPHRLDERSLPVFAALVERHGQVWGKRVFAAWADAARHDTPPWRGCLPRLCAALTTAGAHARTLSEWLLAREVGVLRGERVAERRQPVAFAEKFAERHLDDIVALFAAAAVLPAPALHDELVTVLTTPDTALPLTTAGALLRRLRERGLDAKGLYNVVVAALSAALASPARSLDDWSIAPPTGCACELCRELASFLRDKHRTQYPWRLAKERRSHVHHVIDSHGLPVTHVTIRQGSPYTLVLTKQVALFEREADERTRWQALRTWLEGERAAFTATPKPTPPRGTKAARSPAPVSRQT